MQKKGHNVFVVTAGCYSDYHIQAIFDDLEQAQIYCAINSGCNEDIEIYNTKEAVLNTDKTVKKTWFAVIGEKGKIHSLRFQYSLLQIDSVAKIDRSYENFENHKWKYGYFDDFVVYEIKATLDKEITEDKAKKIIFDRLTKWKAEHLETI